MIGKLKGVLFAIGDKQDISSSFSKKECVIHVPDGKDSKWDMYYNVEFTQKNIEKLNDWSVGTTVEIDVNVKGRKWEKDGRKGYFTSIEGFNISKVSEPESVSSKSVAAVDVEKAFYGEKKDIKAKEPVEDGFDDLPF